MSKLNPNAGEWVPTFSTKSSSVASPVKEKAPSSGDKTPVKKSETETPTPAAAVSTNSKTALERAAEFGHDVALDENGEPISYEGYSPLHDRFIYSKEYLLAFQPLGDRVIKASHVVKNPTPPKFQPLFEMMPEDFTWADTIGADAVMDENKGKKSKKDKNRQQRGNVMSYDASLVCYFNPTEYATAMNMGLYTEAIIAKRRVATLLDDVQPETVSSTLESFMGITISCTHTLQEIIGLLFDHAIANPDLSDSYAKLCSGMSERTPEFKDGAKTINFRRILLTNGAALVAKEVYAAEVGFVGELFRRQLLTENIMHVCVAMMLDDE
ncbi:Armadillo-type fold [Phytophthora cactorum]|nr:Armadillo-type fold [Phytophthora cactorum]